MQTQNSDGLVFPNNRAAKILLSRIFPLFGALKDVTRAGSIASDVKVTEEMAASTKCRLVLEGEKMLSFLAVARLLRLTFRHRASSI